MSQITQLLSRIQDGDPHAASTLLPLVYDELRQLAAARMANERPGQTLQATALVHEAYAKLVGQENSFDWQSRWQFFSAVAKAMRQILIDNARRKQRAKHGGQLKRVVLDEVVISVSEPNVDILKLDDALTELALEHPEKAELVHLRFFGSLSVEQAAQAMGISPATAARHWRYSRAWLAQKMRE